MAQQKKTIDLINKYKGTKEDPFIIDEEDIVKDNKEDKLYDSDSEVTIWELPAQVEKLMEEDVVVCDPIAERLNKDIKTTTYRLQPEDNYNNIYMAIRFIFQLRDELKNFKRWLKWYVSAEDACQDGLYTRVEDIIEKEEKWFRPLEMIEDSCQLVKLLTGFIEEVKNDPYREQRIFMLNLCQARLDLAILCGSCLSYKNDYTAFWAYNIYYTNKGAETVLSSVWKDTLERLENEYKMVIDPSVVRKF